LGIPLRAELERSLAAFEWPLWMPGVLGGMPLLASSNLQFIYPTDFFGCVSGLSIQALTLVDAIIHVALSGIGMYLFLRRLDRGQAASLLGAFFFSLSGTQVSQVYGGFYSFVQAIAMLPWAFWAAHKAWREGSWFAWGLCGLALGLQILSASFQLFCYTAAAVTAFVLFLALEDRARMRAQAGSGRGAGAGPAAAVAGLALAALFAVFLSAPLLWLQIQYQPLCARHAYGYAKFIEGSISLKESLSWLVPGFFGWHWPSYHGALGDCFTSEYFGLLPWGLACAALAALWRREARVRWMAGLALCAWLIAQRQWTPFPYLFIHLPVVSGFRIWSRVLLLLTFAVCTLAAFGWDVLWNPLEPQCRRRGAWGLAAWSALGLLAAALAWAFADAWAPWRGTRRCAALPYPRCWERPPWLSCCPLARVWRGAARGGSARA
jgi:hypothetical protein